MRVGIVIFAYNRSRHLREVLAGLKKNQGVEKIYIFQDGLKCEDHRLEWEKTKAVIETVDWCEKDYKLSSYNKGLARSLVDGINAVFEENDAVIVLEDDCVPTANFIAFMKQCFEKYKVDESVYCVSGYSWPIQMEKGEWDIYGCGRISSLGWGTWKDKWSIYKKDYEIMKKFKCDMDLSRRLALWGKDLENILIGNICGNTDSWAIFWALEVILHDGICINPYKSLIKNIGMDGSGVHSLITDEYEVVCDTGDTQTFSFPDEICILEETQKAFTTLWGGRFTSYTAMDKPDDDRERALVYGLGDFFLKNEKQVNHDFYIMEFIDGYKKGYFAGRNIIKPEEIGQYSYDKILIMIQDVQTCIDVARKLLAYNVDAEKIVLGISMYGNYSKYFDRIGILANGEIQLHVNVPVCGREILLNVRSKDEFNNVREVFVNQVYHYCINNQKKDIVFDIGMNVGDAVLYFLMNPKVEKVYAYEPFGETFQAAVDNLHRNFDLLDRVETFQYGISNENSKREIPFNANMTCGQSTLEDMRKIAYEKYQHMGLVHNEQEEKEIIEVKDAAEIFLPILDKYEGCNFVLKMDCEGEEYGIINRLAEEKLLDRFSLIMLEWHYKGNEVIINQLTKAGFSYWCEDKSDDMGLIYAYKER